MSENKRLTYLLPLRVEGHERAEWKLEMCVVVELRTFVKKAKHSISSKAK